MHETMNAFVDSKPTIESSQINIHTYIRAGVEASLGYEQIWCKMKNTDAIVMADIGVGPGDLGECSLMNQEAIQWALDNVSTDIRDDYFAASITIDYLADEIHAMGVTWAPSEFTFTQVGPDQFTMQATNLRTPADFFITTLAGMNYCKLLSPEGARDFVTDVAAGNLN